MDEYHFEKYQYHKKTFRPKETIYLKIFEEMLYERDNFSLECSLNLDQGNANPARFNVWYDKNNKNPKQDLNNIFCFLREIERRGKVVFDRSLLGEILDKKTDYRRIKEVVMGVDFRENAADSKIKVWLFFDQYQEKRNQALSVHGRGGEVDFVLKLFNPPLFLFGFHLYFNGKSKIEIYPYLKDELKRESTRNKLKQAFGEKISGLIKNCSMINLSFHGKSHKKVFHFLPFNRTEFIGRLNYNLLKEIDSKIKKKYPKGVVSLLEEEIIKNKIKNANLYY